jgi:hypothetical protein
VKFSVQKLHPALQQGQRLTIAEAKVAIFSQQSNWDSGCALHCLAMAAAMHGKLPDPVAASWRRRGAAADFWRFAAPYCLKGIDLSELASLIRELEWGLRPSSLEGSHQKVLRFCEQELALGRVVIVSWSPMNRSRGHAVLAVGVEGLAEGRTFEGRVLLALDPGENEPWLSSHNARMTYGGPALGKRAQHAIYVTAGSTTKVVVTGAISIRAGSTACVRRSRRK